MHSKYHSLKQIIASYLGSKMCLLNKQDYIIVSTVHMYCKMVYFVYPTSTFRNDYNNCNILIAVILIFKINTSMTKLTKT